MSEQKIDKETGSKPELYTLYNNVFLSDDDLDKFFSQDPVKSKVLKSTSRIIFLKSNPQIFGLNHLREHLYLILYALSRLGRFAQSKLDNLKKHFV